MRIPGIPYVQGRNSYSDPDGTKYGIAIHNTSNTASAEAEASYATRRTDGVSSHFYVDGDSIVQSLDTSARAGHAGSSQGNNHAVAVEIRGVNGWTRQQWLDGVAWDLLGAVLAQVCRAYGVVPRRASVAEMQSNPKVRAFYGHDDMRRAWGGTTHTDPGPSFPWDRLFGAVNAHLNPQSVGGDMAAVDTNDPSYRNLIYTVTALAAGIDVQATAAAGGPTVSITNQLARKLDRLEAAAAADESRDAATLAAVKALTVATGADPQPILDAIAAARSETHNLVVQLQQQLAEVQARNLKQAQALAAAGVAFEAADD